MLKFIFFVISLLLFFRFEIFGRWIFFLDIFVFIEDVLLFLFDGVWYRMVFCRFCICDFILFFFVLCDFLMLFFKSLMLWCCFFNFMFFFVFIVLVWNCWLKFVVNVMDFRCFCFFKCVFMIVVFNLRNELFCLIGF